MKKKTNGSFKKGHKVPIIWRKKISDKNKGKHYSIDTEFKKGSKVNLGRKHCLKQNNKHGEYMKKLFKEGKIKSYSKGKTYEELFGENAELEKRKRVEIRMRNGSYKVRNETKEKIKSYWLINKHPNKGRVFPRELYPNHGVRGFRNRLVLPKKDTSIEVKIQEFLSLLHIEFFTHKYMKIEHGYQCDIFIPEQTGIKQKTIIEADGCYWHGCPICKLNSYKKLGERKQLDDSRTKELIEKGFRVIRLWEHKIRIMELNEFRKILK